MLVLLVVQMVQAMVLESAVAFVKGSPLVLESAEVLLAHFQAMVAHLLVVLCNLPTHCLHEVQGLQPQQWQQGLLVMLVLRGLQGLQGLWRGGFVREASERIAVAFAASLALFQGAAPFPAVQSVA